MEIGRVKAHRGNDGSMTVRIHEGDAADWTSVQRVWLGREDGPAEPFSVVSRRAYRDRLVLRLAGVEDGNAAASLRGRPVIVPLDEAPPTDEDVWYHAELEGLEVLTQDGRLVGVVRAVVPTAGKDLLAVAPQGGSAGGDDDVLIPLVREIVVEVDEAAGRIVVDPPAGLLELNRETGA